MYSTKTLPINVVIPKPMIEWRKEESKESEWNIKWIYAIIKAVIPDQKKKLEDQMKCPTPGKTT